MENLRFYLQFALGNFIIDEIISVTNLIVTKPSIVRNVFRRKHSRHPLPLLVLTGVKRGCANLEVSIE